MTIRASPVLTLTARDNRVEFLHNGGDTNPDGTLGRLARAPLTDFLGNWVEVYLRLTHTNSGEIDLSVRDVATGTTLITFGGAGIDLFRGEPGEPVINRPKWGVYRALNPTANLRDEMVRFANFCSSESSQEACPSIITVVPPQTGAVTHALPADASQNVPLYMPLVWDAEPQATSYKVYLGTTATPPLVETVTGTTYYFQIGAVNAEGGTKNAVQYFTTLDNPDDGVWEVARGHARPNVEAPQFFEFDTNLSGTADIDSTGSIPGEAGNNAHTFFSTEGSTGNHRWRYRPEVDEELTVVLRLAPIADQNNITYVGFRSLGYRQKLNIKRSSVRFEQAPGSSTEQTVDFNGFWDDEAFHVIRLTFARGADGVSMVTTMYLDENAEPFASFPSTTSTGSNYMDIGRAGGDDIGASYDYIAINPTGAMAPQSGANAAPPADLSASPALPVQWASPLTATPSGPGKTLLRWAVNNQRDCEFFKVEHSLDGVTFESLSRLRADGNLAERRDFTFTDTPDSGSTVYYRIRQTDFGGAFSFSNVVAGPANGAAGQAISPNPVRTTLTLRNLPSVELTYSVMTSFGREVAKGLLVGQNQVINVAGLPTGFYYLQTRTEAGVQAINRFQKL